MFLSWMSSRRSIILRQMSIDSTSVKKVAWLLVYLYWGRLSPELCKSLAAAACEAAATGY